MLPRLLKQTLSVASKGVSRPANSFSNKLTTQSNIRRFSIFSKIMDGVTPTDDHRPQGLTDGLTEWGMTQKDAALNSRQDLERVKNGKFGYAKPEIRDAYALYEAFKSAGQLDTLESQIRIVVDSLEKNPDLAKIFMNTNLSKSARAEAWEQFLEVTDINDLMFAYLAILGENDRAHDFLSAFLHVENIHNKVRVDKKVVDVTAAEPLSDTQVEEIVQTVKETFKTDSEIELNVSIDPKLRGGYELIYDDTYYLDNSQKSAAATLRAEIKAELGRIRAQQIDSDTAAIEAARRGETVSNQEA